MSKIARVKKVITGELHPAHASRGYPQCARSPASTMGSVQIHKVVVGRQADQHLKRILGYSDSLVI